MARDIHRAPTHDGVSDGATTQVRKRPDLSHPMERYIAWLERIAENLARAGTAGHLQTCEQLIAELRRIVRDDDRAGLGPMAPEIHHCIGGMRSILRAVRAGDVPLEHDLRVELVELVKEISETILERDLG